MWGAVYNEDVVSAEAEDLCDLSAPLKWGQQDPKSVPPDGKHYARLYPAMLQPIPRDAEPACGVRTHASGEIRSAQDPVMNGEA